MRSDNVIPASTQYLKTKEKPKNGILTQNRNNPWKSPDLLEFGWSEFMKKKAEETLKSLNEVKIEDFRKQKTLARTSSAPVNIPKQRQRNGRNQSKKKLIRVSSTGTQGNNSPGSPRITYDRDFLLNCRQSPLSLTPPTNLPEIPGATVPFHKRNKKVLVKTDSNLSAASTSSVCSADSSSAEKEAMN